MSATVKVRSVLKPCSRMTDIILRIIESWAWERDAWFVSTVIESFIVYSFMCCVSYSLSGKSDYFGRR